MAVVKFGAIVTGVIGSIAGVTYSTYNGRNIVRRKPQPVGRHQGIQPQIRAILGFCTRYWAQLTETQRNLWRAYAQAHPVIDKFGESALNSGFQWFVKLNIIHITAYAGTDIKVVEPPTAEPICTLQTIVASDGPATGQVVITPAFVGTELAADRVQYQRAGPFTSQGKVSVDSFFTSQANAPGDDGPTTYSGLQAEAWYWWRGRYLELDNYPSNWIYAQWQVPTVA